MPSEIKMIFNIKLFFIFSMTCFSALAGPIDDLKPGHWYEVPDSKLSESGVVAVPLPPGGQFKNIINAWSGGAYDTKRDRLIIFGGGHADYSGNEIYVFDVATLKWIRASDPSLDVGGDKASGVYPDGRPRSRHSYSYIEYVPTMDRFCSFGGAALYPSGNTSTARTDCFNFETQSWELKKSLSSARGSIGASADFDPRTGKIYRKSGGTTKVSVYDPATDSWSSFGSSFYKRNRLSTAIDFKRGILVFYGGTELILWDIVSGASETVNAIGTSPTLSSPGLVYDSKTENIVAWEGGASIYVLDIEKLSWSKHNPADDNTVTPPSQPGNGTFGRFRYIPSKNAFIVVNSVSQNVFFYKLSPGAGEPVDRTPPMVPSNLIVK